MSPELPESLSEKVQEPSPTPATAGMRRRPGRTSSSASGGGGGGFSGGGCSNMLCFYTDKAPGLRLFPTMVLVMSLCFIGTVKEILGTCVSVGCTVDGNDPKDLQTEIDDGEVEIPSA